MHRLLRYLTGHESPRGVHEPPRRDFHVQLCGLACAVAIACLAFTACNSHGPGYGRHEGDRDREHGDNQRNDDVRRERESYQQKAQEKLRDLDAQIDRLKARLQIRNDKDRKNLEPELTDLQQKRQVANDKLEKLKESTEAAWGDMKVGIDAALNDLDAACKQAASHFQ